MAVASFHIIGNAEILAKLRAETASAKQPLDWRQLEKLPYLYGCVHEAIRLSHGITTRDPRLAPDTELQYGDWTIPRNTPVSMTNVDVLMNERIFPDPKAFVPERWTGRPELERYFVPFGKGSRQCLGIKSVVSFCTLYYKLANERAAWPWPSSTSPSRPCSTAWTLSSTRQTSLTC